MRVFISYRRDDADAHAGRLYDSLAAHSQSSGFEVFMDVDRIRPGRDFVEVIDRAVESSDVLIALIGRNWLTAAGSRGRRRLDNPSDFVRVEIEAALQRGITVIPALVHDAEMPTADDLPPSMHQLARRNAIEIRHGSWHQDVERLVRTLESIEQEVVEHGTPQPDAVAETRPARDGTGVAATPGRTGTVAGGGRGRGRYAAAAAALIAVIGVAAWLATRGGGSNPQAEAGVSTSASPSPRPSSASSTPSASPSPTPSASVTEPRPARLLDYVASAVRSSCRPTPGAQSIGALERVACRSGPMVLTYLRFPNSGDMDEYFHAWFRRGHIHGSHGSCLRSDGDPALGAGPWTKPRGYSGLLLCFKDSGGHAFFVWQTCGIDLFAIAVRPDGDANALRSWWNYDYNWLRPSEKVGVGLVGDPPVCAA